MKKTLTASLIASALFPAFAAADESQAAMSPMIVVGTAPEYNDLNLAGSVDSISRDELAISHINNTMELFTKVPGVYFARYNQGIINTDIGIRGFAAEGSSPHAKLLIDGIPSNLSNGYSELDQLFPGDIQNMQIYKGNSDPRYGAFNVAGNYNITTRNDLATEVEVTAGSFDAKEIQAYSGLNNGKLTHNYFFGYRNSEGYRDNFKLDKLSASGRWFYDFNNSTTLGFIARIADYDADAPGYLTRQEARAHPTRSAEYASEDGGDKQTQAYSVHLDHAFSEDIDWSVKAYFNHYERQRWVRFSEAKSLQNRFDDQDHYGLTSTVNWRVAQNWTIDWGLNIEQQDTLEQRFSSVDNKRQRNALTRNNDFDMLNYGTYLQVSNTLTDWFEWNAALRADRFSGDGQFGTSTAVDKDLFDYGTILQPKLNMFFYPADTVTVFANYGRSFQHPLMGAAYTEGDTSARDISLNDGWELGTKWAPVNALELRLSYWEQRATDEFIVVDGDAQNVGKTQRKGIDFGFNWTLTQELNVWGNFATADSEVLDQGANKGNELRSIPDYTSSIGMSYNFTPSLTWRVHMDSQAGSYVNEANIGGKYGEFDIVNTSIDYVTSWGTINAQVNNLFDEYYEYVYDFSSDASSLIFSPGDGINASVSVSYKFN